MSDDLGQIQQACSGIDDTQAPDEGADRLSDDRIGRPASTGNRDRVARQITAGQPDRRVEWLGHHVDVRPAVKNGDKKVRIGRRVQRKPLETGFEDVRELEIVRPVLVGRSQRHQGRETGQRRLRVGVGINL